MQLTLARTLACSAESCQVQLLDDSGVSDAPLAALMVQRGILIRPDMIVALDRSTTPAEIRWRFEVRPVEALAGDRLTLHGKEFRFVDVRPDDEHATPIRVGTTVVSRLGHDGETLEVFDTVEHGRPRYPERLEAHFPHIEAVYEGAAHC
jgi:hypothetical protein